MFENRSKYDPSAQNGPGPFPTDFVPTLTLNMVLQSISKDISIDFLKIDAQGHDLEIIKSANPEELRRVPRISTEVFLERREHVYKNISNSFPDWIDYMSSIVY